MLDEHLTNHDKERTCPNCESVNGEVRISLGGTEGCPFCITRCAHCNDLKENECFSTDGICPDCHIRLSRPDLLETFGDAFKPRTAHGDIVDDKICVN